MVSSRHRSSLSTASESTPPSANKLTKPPLEEWTTREKLCLASLAIKHGNAWNSVARNMQSFVEKDRPDGWSNQKTCAAQFDKLMNELGVDKRPKRNEPSDGNSSSVIYKKMVEKRVKELEESIVDLRKKWLATSKDLSAVDDDTLTPDRLDQLKQLLKSTPITTTISSTIPTTTTPVTTSTSTPATAKTSSKTNIVQVNETPEKPPTRALTRRESSRQNLEKTLSILCKEASEIKSINLLGQPANESEREFYDKVILKHIDITVIKKRLGGEVDDAYAVMNDLLLMFQNATMFYPVEHPTYRAAVDLREKLVPQWEKALIDRFKARH